MALQIYLKKGKELQVSLKYDTSNKFEKREKIASTSDNAIVAGNLDSLMQ